ncbi:MAG: RagB/SusD family nutrient uptake outer membrane protein [Deltaproteobacteria bacterium]|nr:RagB/SusD family nutrient uptake outer membrane protein [Deltaproteobacteria bacterium]
MKKFKFIIITVLLVSFGACDEGILVEEPLDFYSPENSYQTPADIDAALVSIYRQIRVFYLGNWKGTTFLHVGTDLGMGCRNPATDDFGDYRVALVPNTDVALSYWKQFYKMVFNSNTILDRLEAIDYNSEEEKNAQIAEAKFFRGYAYRCLINLYGGVPIVLNEITSPQRDFVRATKEESIAQAINDLEFAADYLPGVAEVKYEGKVSSAAALHVLAELYISAGDYDKSITAASAVIDDPNISLMTTRFGRKADIEGDPYWDLFQRFNLNRSSGNMEGILVLQNEFNIPGGADGNAYGDDGFLYERTYGPLYWFLNDPDGEKIFIGPTTQNGGRPVGFIRFTPYFLNGIWDTDNWDVDIRNNERNIQRDWVVDNPSSAYFGQKISDFPQSWYDNLSDLDTLRDYHPLATKISTYNDHPDDLMKDTETGVVESTAGATYNDWYLMRVAETYLLRAEAYLNKGDMAAAAEDINAVRNRAGAIDVDAADVNIDYILDERMRELSWEEPRRMTLSRLGLLPERVTKYNPYSGLTVESHNNLFPIPYSEIERNTLEVLEQNPGYIN